MTNSKFYSLLKKVKRKLAIIETLSDQELREKTLEFKDKIARGVSLNKLLPEAFAVVCEADKRVLGMMPFDCQIVGGIALHYCYLAEMNTGEGKTLTATMPLYLNALSGKGSILVTANEYLANRDAEEMGPVYEFLGLTVRAGVSINPEKILNDDEKREIYSSDIVYTTHSVLSFDYLFNNLVKKAEGRFLRDFNYVIIDEADMVLMDAAQNPLVVSGVPRVQSNLYQLADFFVNSLKEERDYIKEDDSVWLTDEGVAYAEQFFGIDEYYSKKNFEINRHVSLSLKAHVIMKKEKDYVISEKNEIVLLDSGTGRLLPKTKLRNGLHQAIESKEKVEISKNNRSVASITYQNLFLLFPRMSGMSGTISDARKELRKIYKKKVTIIPPNKPLQRVDKKDVFFNNSKKQFDAAVEEALRLHEDGRPVLIVTSSIKDTELVSKMLINEQIPHSVLNANNAYWEAQIIKEAGKARTITVSTGMAGRGTDIKLDDESRELGGLAVIGIGRMANVRLERQVRGRAGRQGDPGSSQFFVSLEDDIVKKLEEKHVEKYIDDSRKISKGKLRKIINSAQKTSEEIMVSHREKNVDYDKVVKRQRNLMYDVRNRLLDGGSLEGKVIINLIKESVKSFFKDNSRIKPKDVNRYLLDNINYCVDQRFVNTGRISKRKLKKLALKYVDEAWKKKQNDFVDLEERDEYVRLCTLKALDDAWVEQIDYLQQLQNVVSGRNSAQMNTVFEYHTEAYDSFERMEKSIKKNIVRNIMLGKKNYTNEGKMSVLLP